MTDQPQSPFLPGTNIQFAWDSTSLDSLKRCPRLYQYTLILGYQPKGENIHLRFGQEYHSAIEDYDKLKAEDWGHQDAIAETLHRLLIRIHDWDVDTTCKPGDSKNPRSLIQLVIDYLDHYEDDPAQTYILDNGKPAVELSFRFELPWGPTSAITNWDADRQPVGWSQPYLLCGHLDRVVSFNSDLFVLDHKTTTTTPSDYYFAGFNPSNQMTLYTIAGKIVYDIPIKGVIVEAAQITKETPNKFVRRPTHRTQDQLDEWLADLHYWLALAEQYATADVWPMNDTSCSMYGGCKFQGVCSKSPSVRKVYLKSDFIQLEPSARWNPLAVR